MIDILLNCVGRGTGRQILNWRRFVDNVYLKMEIYRSRYLLAPFVYNKGTNLLINILKLFDINSLKEIDSDMSLYSKAETYATQARNRFDPVYTNYELKGFFVDGSSVPEYILNTSCSSPFLTLPIGKDWTYWQDLRPMCVLWHDSKELNLTLWRQKITFFNLKPTRIFYSLNVPLLIMRYVKYSKYCDEHGLESSPENYVKDYVMYSWFDDLIRIWLTTVLTNMLEFKFYPYEYRSEEIITPIAALTNVYPEIKSIASQASVRALSIGDIFNTKWFKDQTLTDWMHWLKNNVVLPPFNQYVALDFISSMPYYRFIIDTMSVIGRRDIELPARTILYDLRMYKNRKIGSALYSGQLKSLVNIELDALLKKVGKIVTL